jgi:hypothetical protein
VLLSGPCSWGGWELSRWARFASRKSLSPCRRIVSSSRFVGLMILPFFLRGAAGQCSCPAGKGPWQLAHFGAARQFSPEGPLCISVHVLQCWQRECRVHFAGLQNPWHPGLCLIIVGRLSISLDGSLALNSRN